MATQEKETLNEPHQKSNDLENSTKLAVDLEQPRPINVIINTNKMEPHQFDGEISWPAYLIQFNMISELNNWTSHEKLLYLGASLTGKAREVLRNTDSKMRDTFEGLVQCLSERFGPDKHKDVFKALLQNKTQQPDENFHDLAHSIMGMVQSAYPTVTCEMADLLAKDHFIEAIGDSTIRDLVLFNEPNTLNEAVRIALRIQIRKDQGINEKSGRGPSSSPFGESETASGFPSKIKDTLQVMEMTPQTVATLHKDNMLKLTREANKKGQQLVCFKCGQLGHKMRECPRSKHRIRNKKF